MMTLFLKKYKIHKGLFHLHYIKGILPFMLIVLNLSFWILPLTILALLKIIFPFHKIQKRIYWIMERIYYFAAWFDGILLFRILGIRLEVNGLDQHYPGNLYLVIANHQSWSDIFVLQHLLNFRAPVLKFLAKRELIFMPIIGLICWAYDFPILNRQSPNRQKDRNKTSCNDIRSLKLAMDKFEQSSASIMNFIEGTRFSAAKSKSQNSPYTHLLKPKAGGLCAILRTLGTRLDAIINITIAYDSPDLHFWDFLCGQCKRITITAKTITIKEAFGPDLPSINPPDDGMITAWINELWGQKDYEMNMMKNSLQK